MIMIDDYDDDDRSVFYSTHWICKYVTCDAIVFRFHLFAISITFVGSSESWESWPNNRWWFSAICGCIQWAAGCNFYICFTLHCSMLVLMVTWHSKLLALNERGVWSCTLNPTIPYHCVFKIQLTWFIFKYYFIIILLFKIFSTFQLSWKIIST